MSNELWREVLTDEFSLEKWMQKLHPPASPLIRDKTNWDDEELVNDDHYFTEYCEMSCETFQDNNNNNKYQTEVQEDLKLIKWLFSIKPHIDLHYDDSRALLLSREYGHKELEEWLLTNMCRLKPRQVSFGTLYGW